MGISVKNLTKQYGAQTAVNNISFDVNKGEIVGFLGPNGAGKSTTMKIATCYLPPTSGTVLVDGYDVVTSPKDVRSVTGYLPEHNPLYLDMYVHEYLQFAASLHGITGEKARKSSADMVALVGLEKEQRKRIGALSKGYRQRVGLAQSLIHDPSVLILDEPTTGLDPNQIQEIRNVIKETAKHKTVILSTHIMQEVQALCDRVVIISQGNIVANEKVDVLQSAGNETRVLVEFESGVSALAYEQIDTVTSVQQLSDNQILIITNSSKEIRGDIFRAAVKKNDVIIQMTKESISLEHIFKQLTQSQVAQ